MFMGYESVLEDLEKAPKRTSGTLVLNDGSATNVTWANLYVWPQTEQVDFGAGSAGVSGTVTLWRLGETSKPRAGDTITVGGFSWLIGSVNSRLNGDETSGYAVYDCRISRPAKSTG